MDCIKEYKECLVGTQNGTYFLEASSARKKLKRKRYRKYKHDKTYNHENNANLCKKKGNLPPFPGRSRLCHPPVHISYGVGVTGTY